MCQSIRHEGQLKNGIRELQEGERSQWRKKNEHDDTTHMKANECHSRDNRLIHIFLEPDEMKISQDPATQITFPIGWLWSQASWDDTETSFNSAQTVSTATQTREKWELELELVKVRRRAPQARQEELSSTATSKPSRDHICHEEYDGSEDSTALEYFLF